MSLVENCTVTEVVVTETAVLVLLGSLPLYPVFCCFLIALFYIFALPMYLIYDSCTNHTKI